MAAWVGKYFSAIHSRPGTMPIVERIFAAAAAATDAVGFAMPARDINLTTTTTSTGALPPSPCSPPSVSAERFSQILVRRRDGEKAVLMPVVLRALAAAVASNASPGEPVVCAHCPPVIEVADALAPDPAHAPPVPGGSTPLSQAPDNLCDLLTPLPYFSAVFSPLPPATPTRGAQSAHLAASQSPQASTPPPLPGAHAGALSVGCMGSPLALPADAVARATATRGATTGVEIGDWAVWNAHGGRHYVVFSNKSTSVLSMLFPLPATSVCAWLLPEMRVSSSPFSAAPRFSAAASPCRERLLT